MFEVIDSEKDAVLIDVIAPANVKSGNGTIYIPKVTTLLKPSIFEGKT